MQTQARCETFDALNHAELFDIQSGLIGSKTEHFYHALSGVDQAMQSPIAWRRMFQSAKKTKSIAIAVKALQDTAMRAKNTPDESLHWMILGHFLRFVAQDSAESALAYANAYSDNWEDALCAILALHRLRRSEPQCEEASAAIAALQKKCPLKLDSKTKIEARIRNLPDDDPGTRAQAFIDLALNAILEGGDACRALEWIGMAQTLNPNVTNATEILASILRAVPDNLPIIQNIIHTITQKQAWKDLEQFAIISECLPFSLPDSCILDFSMMYATKLNNELRSAHYLYRCAFQNPKFWADAVLKQSWICLYATDHTVFRNALWEGIKLISNDHVTEAFLNHLGRFGKSPEIRTQAHATMIRQMISGGSPEKALKLLSGSIKDMPEQHAFAFYDLLSELIKPMLTPRDTAFNAQILHTADILCIKTQSHELYRRFLFRFWELFPEQQELTQDALTLRQSIQKKLSTDTAVTTNLPAPQAITPENTPILASCLELIRNHQTNQAMQNYFEWFDVGADFGTALNILNLLHAAITEQKPFDFNIIKSTIAPEFVPDSDMASVSTILALALILQPDDSPWLERIKSIHPCWDIVTKVLLQYLPYLFSGDLICDIIENSCLCNLDENVSNEIFNAHLVACMKYDVLLKQVIRMSENNAQQNQLLEKMDEAIATFSGDVAQKNALYAKKYKTAEMLGDERVKMMCLRDILETTPNDAFAISELNRLKPEQLKPHSQILYYQLRILTEPIPSIKLENQIALAALYAQSSQINNAITLYHTIIDEHPEYPEARYRLLDLLESLENWKSAENVLLALINAETSPQNRYQSLVRLAVIQNERMMMPSRALLTLFAALDIDPLKLNALHARLCEISERLHSFSPLLDKYEDFATHSNDYVVRRTATLLLANVYAEHINKKALACNVLDEFYRNGGSNDPEFLQMMLSFNSSIQNWNGYVQVLSAQIKATQDNAEKVKLALTAASICEKNLNDIPNALNFAKLAADANPQNSQAWIEIADYFVAADQSDNAIQPLRMAAELESNTNQKVLILLEASQILLENGKLNEAASLFHSIIQFNPELDKITPVAESLIAMATTRVDIDIFNLVCDDLVQCCPEEEQTPLLLQKALTFARVFGAPEEARHIIENIADSLNALDEDQSIMLAQILTSIGESEAAIEMFQNIFANFQLSQEQKVIYLRELLKNAIEINDIDIVLSTAEALVEIEPDDANANFQLLQYDYYSGHWDQASERIEKFLPHQERLSAENAMLMQYYYGEILHASEDDQRALQCLDNAIRIKHDFRPAVDLKLTILLKLKKWSEALPVFNLLLMLTEDDTEVQGAIHKRIGEIYHFYVNEPEKAVAEYEQALTLGGDVEDVPIRLLQLYQDLELWTKAAMTAQVLAMAQVNSPSARCAYLIVLGDILTQHLGEYSDAINTYLEAFTIEPFNYEILNPLIRLLIDQKQWQNISGVIDHLCDLIDTDQETAIKCITKIACSVWSFEPCHESIQKADVIFKSRGTHLNLIEYAKTHALPLEEICPKNTRKKTNMSEGTRVPSLQKSVPQLKLITPVEDAPSTDNLRTITATDLKKTAAQLPSSSTENPAVPAPLPNDIEMLPDDALMPIDTNSDAAIQSIETSVPVVSPNRTITKAEATKALDNLTFTLDDINALAQNASPFTIKCIDDIYDIASVSHDEHQTSDLPSKLSDIARQNLLMTSGSPLNPGFIRMLSVFGTKAGSPLAVTPSEPLHDPNISTEQKDIFNLLCSLLKTKNVQLKSRPISVDPALPVLNTVPATVLCDSMQLASMSKHQWIARMAFALVLAQPENILCACIPLTDLHAHLMDASVAISPMRSGTSNLTPETIEQYKRTLISAGITAATTPRITPSTLSLLKQHAAYSQKIAIQTALIFSQSLIDCLQILIELENLHFPTTLISLKSVMKSSPLIKSLILFALSPNTQRIYDKVYK
ncbi:MAG: tetratricopeptide repeat protein [Proteobacteria bacterium]|nr:tetratricopeptide repeat protein [Pseudomonadota bacterium]